MLVSVIIPVYNSEPFLHRLADCLKTQHYKDVEYIFVNDASSDNSEALIRSMLSDLPSGKIINNPVNKGTGFSRNVGVAASRGDYIFFLDHDDVISPDCLDILVSNATKHDNPDLIIGDVSCSDYHYRFGNNRFIEGNQTVREKYFLHVWYEMPWNKLIKREFLLDNNLFFDENVYYEDTVWSFRVCLKAKTVLLVPRVTYFFQQSKHQKTTRIDFSREVHERVLVYQKMFDAVSEDGNDSNSRIYLLDLSTSFIISLINNSLIPPDSSIRAFTLIRELVSIKDVGKGFFSHTLPLGMKIACLYRIFPRTIGWSFLKTFARIVG